MASSRAYGVCGMGLYLEFPLPWMDGNSDMERYAGLISINSLWTGIPAALVHCGSLYAFLLQHSFHPVHDSSGAWKGYQ